MRILLLLLVVLLEAAPARAGTVETRWFVFETAPGREAIASELARSADAVLADVSAGLGTAPAEPRILVRVLHGEDAFRAALPGAGGIAEWAAGVAFPAHGLIVLRVDAQTRFELADVFRHEVSHVALGRAVRQRPLPIWFVEGLAVRQAGERLLERWDRTAAASLGDGLLPLAALENGFPQEGSRADLAYAESSAFLGFLIQRNGWGPLRTIIARVGDGQPFAQAFRGVYGRSVQDLEADWRELVQASASWLPVLTGASLLWVAVVLLFVWSWVVRRRRAKAVLPAMPDPADDEYA